MSVIKSVAILDGDNRVENILIVKAEEPETDRLIAYTKENPAFIGGDFFDGFFYAPQPFPSWSRNGSGDWVAPVDMPDDGQAYAWDEEAQDWVVAK